MESGDRTSLLHRKNDDQTDYGSSEKGPRSMFQSDSGKQHPFRSSSNNQDNLRISLTPSMTVEDMNDVNTAFAKKSSQHALLNIETLSRTKSLMLMTLLYTTLLSCTAASIVDYWFMWECTNICTTETYHTQSGCSFESEQCMTIHDNSSITWTGGIHGLTKLNRFMHMTFILDNPNENRSNNTPIVSIKQLEFNQLAYTNPDKPPYNKTFYLPLTCTLGQSRCSTLQLPVSDLPWSDAYNTSITLLNAPDSITALADTVTIIFQYQKDTYTMFELVLRCVLVTFTIFNMCSFVRLLRKWGGRWLTEQQYILACYGFLLLYLDPFYPLATFDSRSSSGIGFWVVIQFLEFHCSTYFFLFVQVLVVVILTSVRRTDGTVSTATHVVCLVWFTTMLAIDLAIALRERDNTSDYSSTFVWFMFTHNIKDFSFVSGFLYFTALFLEVGWFLWLIRGIFRCRDKLRKQPYFETRHRQLAFRYLFFMVGGYLAYQLLTASINWTIKNGFSVTYRSTQEIGAVVLSFVFVQLLAYIYSPAFIDKNAPPAPCYPSWEDPKWKKIAWKDEWYRWLKRHGGSLYFFVRKEEEDFYLQQNPPSVKTTKIEQETVRPSSGSGAIHALSEVVDSAVWLGDKVKETLFDKPLRHLEDALFSEGYKGCPRLFFCLDTCTEMLNLSYRVYSDPNEREKKGIRGPFINRMLTDSVTSVTLGAAVAHYCVVSWLNKSLVQDSEAESVVTDASPVSSTRRSSSPFSRLRNRFRRSTGYDPVDGASFRGPPASPSTLTPRGMDLEHDGFYMYDCIQVAGSQVIICLPDGDLGEADSIIICFRGTYSKEDALTDLNVIRRPWPEMTQNITELCSDKLCSCCSKLPLLHSGFMELWNTLKPYVYESTDSLLQLLAGNGITNPRIYITGHSLGGAMGCLCAYSMTMEKGRLPVVYTFGSPKMGNRQFQRLYNAAVPNTFRVVNSHDVVAHMALTCGNYHIGHEVCVTVGNLLVEPTWIEQTFQPTKTGFGAERLRQHQLDGYARSINSLCEKYGTDKRCIDLSDEEEVAVSIDVREVDPSQFNMVVSPIHNPGNRMNFATDNPAEKDEDDLL
eukprot:TRINITY_DN510_c2_g1_i1.p1 TRINITY_DN510_c2_g1~~TRINITY_DN510_c2_g1_i1.p1  ORF type:complete len:1089 (+),score=134.06 TRINITY_DN510_c2_g1_i1:65-3331(+)